MVTPNSSSKTVNLSEFSAECNSLNNIVRQRISLTTINKLNFEIHDNYKIDANLINERINAIINKFRKCEMIYHLYFDELDHGILTSTSNNFPIVSQRTFQTSQGSIKLYFEADSRILYQELIDYNFQEIILFISSVLENLVYLSETLIRKVSIHTKKNKPQSITMNNFMELLDYLHRLNYRNSADPIATCMRTHSVFLDRYLPTISVFRNKYIHGFSRNLKSDLYEYIITEPLSPIGNGATDLNVNVFAKNIIENLQIFIPDFFAAITATVTSAAALPA
jgi:hypothetical protein